MGFLIVKSKISSFCKIDLMSKMKIITLLLKNKEIRFLILSTNRPDYSSIKIDFTEKLLIEYINDLTIVLDDKVLSRVFEINALNNLENLTSQIILFLLLLCSFLSFIVFFGYIMNIMENTTSILTINTTQE